MATELTHKEMSSRGGKANVAKYGRSKYVEMHQKAIENAKVKYGPAYYLYMYLKQLDTKFKNARMTLDVYNMRREDTLKKIAIIENNPD